MNDVRHILWRALEAPGLEHLELVEDEAVFASSTVIGFEGGQPFTLRYELCGNADWHVTFVTLSVGNRFLELGSAGTGAWWNADWKPVPALDGCLDADISATPFTNTLPIRRLNLHIGQSAEIDVVYISVPDLGAKPARQRYTRVGGHKYRFESLEQFPVG